MPPHEAPQTPSGRDSRLQSLAEEAGPHPGKQRPSEREAPAGKARGWQGEGRLDPESERPPGFGIGVWGPAPAARGPGVVLLGGRAQSLGDTSPLG